MNDKQKKERKVPKLRFPGFTGDWEQRKLGDIAIRVQGNDGRMELPTLTISAANGWMAQEERFSSNIAGKEQKNYTLLRKGELSYNHGNSKLAKYGAVFSLQTYEEALVPRVYHSFKIDEGNADFIEYYFSTKIPDKELGKLISSGARMDGLLNIGFDEFMSIKMNLPSTAEQVKISEYLRKMDTFITLHQHKCNQIRALKKYMLQKMFPKDGMNVPEIRFAGFVNAWEQRKLGEMGSLKNGMNFSQGAMGKGYPFVNLQNVFGKNIIDVNNLGKAEASIQQLKEYSLEKGDVLFVRSSVKLEGVGEAALVPRTLENTTYSGFVIRFRDEVGLDDNFKRFVFSIKPVRDQIMAQATNSANKNVSQVVLENLDIPVPTFEEQEKIGLYFSDIDHLINLHQRKLTHLKELKKGLLQQMFV